MKTTKIMNKDDVQRKWYLVDASGQVLGRMASKIASTLRGKHKPMYSPSVELGDFVIVVNADKTKLTGNKLKGKVYYRHTGYPGGLKAETLEKAFKRNPGKVITDAVSGMLPKNKIGRDMLTHLRVYAGPDNPHNAQQPEVLSI